MLGLPEIDPPGMVERRRYDALYFPVAFAEQSLDASDAFVRRAGDFAQRPLFVGAGAHQEKASVDKFRSAQKPHGAGLPVIVQVARVGDRSGGQPTAKTPQVVSARNEDPAYVAASESEIRKDVVIQPVQLPVAFLP